MNAVRYLKSVSKLLLVLFAAAGLNSCSKNAVFQEYKNIDDALWNKDSIISFSFDSTDTISKNNIYINIRNNMDYEFSNLFLIVGIQFPDNYHIVDTLEYEMTDKNGRFLGTGISDIKENKLEYKTNVTFPKSGKYTIDIQQAMRKNQNVEGIINLNGITDVGVEIEKTN
ncbi:MAG: gliding motility lipoprotein GldH [Flavobacteriia bacterium]|nr:MAG: gliding motility lipoprotein GldH [Flavobacteriia bacterium]